MLSMHRSLLVAQRRAYASAANFQLNKRILDCTSSAQLETLILSSPIDQFNEVNVSTAIKSLAAVKVRARGNVNGGQHSRRVATPPPPFITDVSFSQPTEILLTRAQEMDFSARHLSNICHGIAKGRLSPSIPFKLAQQIVNKVDEFEPQGLSNILWSLATLKEKTPNLALVKVLCNQLAKCPVKLNPQDISNSAWALATLGFPSYDAFERLGTEFKQHHLHDFTAQQLCNISWSYATIKEKHPSFDVHLCCPISELATEINRVLPQFQPKDLSVALWAFSTLESPLLCEPVERELLTRNLVGFSPQAMAGILAAMTKLNHKCDSNVFPRCLDELQRRKLVGYNPQDVANVCWALSSWDLKEVDSLLEMVTQRVPASIHSYPPQDLCRLAWAFASRQYNSSTSPHMFTTIIQHVLSQRDLKHFLPHDLSTLVWSMATLKQPGEGKKQMFDKVALELITRAPTFTPKSLTSFAWAYATLEYTNILLFQTIAGEVIRRGDLAEFKSKDLFMLLWAFAQIGFKDKAMLDAIWKEIKISRKMSGCTSGLLANLLWTSAQFGYADLDLVDAVCKEIVYRKGLSLPSEYCSALWSLASLDCWYLKSVRDVFDLPLPVAPDDRRNMAQLFFAKLAWKQAHGNDEKVPRGLEFAQQKLVHDVDFHKPSSTHVHVCRLLQQRVLPQSENVENEAVLLGGLVVDVFLPDRNMVIEVDGPYHYFVNDRTQAVGKTAFKHRLLKRAGHKVVSIPAVEFEHLSTAQQVDYLRKLMA